ncbi:MAG: nucleotidyltransferase domain-containing protein [Thermoprotei archaeon]
MEIIRKRRELREKVIEEAKKWVSKLPFKCAAVLIGSYARGDFNLWSDVDVLLIADIEGRPPERLKKIDYPPGYEVIVITPREFYIGVEKKNPLVIEAIREGVVLRDDYGIIEEIKKKKT